MKAACTALTFAGALVVAGCGGPSGNDTGTPQGRTAGAATVSVEAHATLPPPGTVGPARISVVIHNAGAATADQPTIELSQAGRPLTAEVESGACTPQGQLVDCASLAGGASGAYTVRVASWDPKAGDIVVSVGANGIPPLARSTCPVGIPGDVGCDGVG